MPGGTEYVKIIDNRLLVDADYKYIEYRYNSIDHLDIGTQCDCSSSAFFVTNIDASHDLSNVTLWDKGASIPQDTKIYYANITGFEQKDLTLFKHYTGYMQQSYDCAPFQINKHQNLYQNNASVGMWLGIAAVVILFIATSFYMPLAYGGLTLASIGGFTIGTGTALGVGYMSYSYYQASNDHFLQMNMWQKHHDMFMAFDRAYLTKKNDHKELLSKNKWAHLPLTKGHPPIVFDGQEKLIQVTNRITKQQYSTIDKNGHQDHVVHHCFKDERHAQLSILLRYAQKHPKKKIMIVPSSSLSVGSSGWPSKEFIRKNQSIFTRSIKK